MRGGWLGGCGVAASTMLLLVAAAMIAQPNIRVLDGAVTEFFDSVFEGEEGPVVEAVVDQITVERDRVRGRVRNASSVPLAQVVVRMRLVPADGGADRTSHTTVYGLAPGQEAWFGIPLVGGPAIAEAELIGVEARAGAASTDSATDRVLRQQRRSGVGGMQEVERMERDMKQMEEAARSITGGQ